MMTEKDGFLFCLDIAFEKSVGGGNRSDVDRLCDHLPASTTFPVRESVFTPDVGKIVRKSHGLAALTGRLAPTGVFPSPLPAPLCSGSLAGKVTGL